MELREFGPDDAASIATYVGIEKAERATDAPWLHPATTFRREMIMRHGWDADRPRTFLGYAGDEPVGYLEIFTSSYDNPELAWLSLAVHPDHRRQGHGTSLVDAASAVCREMGRPLVGVDGWETERTRGFTAATGFEEKSRSVMRRQHLAELPGGLVESLCEEAAKHAGDYELVRLVGASPIELLDELAEVAGAINDAPTDDLEIEDEVYSADRMRAYEEAQLASGWRLYRLLARHRTSGALAGHTVVVVDTETPANGDQHDTAVVREHRGHRLGLLLKAEMVRWLAGADGVEPQLRTLDTWNAESNDHMVGVNERLGYRIMGRTLEFQRRI